MHAMFFKDTCQSHIVAFIKSGPKFDQAGNLFSGFRGVDQAFDERGVAGGSVQRLFDGHHFVVVSGIADEPLDRIVEAFVRVMNEEVAIPDGREHVGALSQPARNGGRPFFSLQIRTGQICQLVVGGRFERTCSHHDRTFGQSEFIQQQGPKFKAGFRLHLEPNWPGESPAGQLGLHR